MDSMISRMNNLFELSQSKYFKLIARVFALLVFLVLSLNLIRYPFKITWDGLAYLGSISKLEGHSVTEIHNFAYHQAQMNDSANYYATLIGDPQYYASHPVNATAKTGYVHYRRATYLDPIAFYQQIPFYSSRRGYFASLETLHSFGISWFQAMRLNMVVPDILILGLAFGTAAFSFDAIGIIIFTFLIAFLNLYKGTPNHSTPDALGLLFELVSYGLLACRRWIVLSLVFAAISTVIRPDSLLLVFSIAGFAFIYYKDLIKAEKIKICLIALLSLLYVYIIQKLSHTYPMQTLFYKSFVHEMAYPIINHKGITLTFYFKQLFTQMFQFVRSMRYEALMIVLLIIFYVRGSKEYRWTSLPLAVGLLTALVHYLVFPAYDDRYFDSVRVSLLVTFALIYSQWWQEGTRFIKPSAERLRA